MPGTLRRAGATGECMNKIDFLLNGSLAGVELSRADERYVMRERTVSEPGFGVAIDSGEEYLPIA